MCSLQAGEAFETPLPLLDDHFSQLLPYAHGTPFPPGRVTFSFY